MGTRMDAGFAGSVVKDLRRDAKRRRSDSAREVAARELRAGLERLVDTHPEAGRWSRWMTA